MHPVRALTVLALLLLPAAARAQSDILTGRVTDAEGRPVVGARVEAMSLETGVSRSVLSDANGRYMIVFADGGGRYELRVSFLGMADRVLAVIRQADEEVLIANVAMSTRPIELDAISVQGRRAPPTQGTTAQQAQELPPELLNRLPLPDYDPTTLALLAAGVVGTVADSLDGRAGFSVAGMSDALNQITLDGVSIGSILSGGGGLDVPLEGLRRTQVVTSTFDVSRGGFAGGQVAMTTARGNNFATGSFTYQLRDAALSGSAGRSVLGNAATQHRLSGGYGGPVVRNRLFYNLSFGLTQRTSGLYALAPADPFADRRTGVAADSVDRFLAILGSTHGFPTAGLTGAFANRNGSLSLQARTDWNATPRHTVMLRVNANVAGQDSARISPFDLRHNGGEQESDRLDGAVSVTSRLGGAWTNELQVSGFRSSGETRAFLDLPEGRVRVSSALDDGSRAVSTLVFGGDRSLPTETSERRFAVRNELGFLLGFTHRIRAGAEVGRSRFASINQTDLLGTFTFNSLQDFEANRPASFTRALTQRERSGGGVNVSVWLSDTWRPGEPLQFTGGLRVDRYAFSERPAYNPAVEAAFGRRTDRFPSDLRVSPRLGFSYRLNEQGTPTRVVRGGIGLFSGSPPANLFAGALQQTGLAGSELSIHCIGDAVPVPDWTGYLLDPGRIPSRCLDGGLGAPVQAAREPSVTVFHPSFAAPGSWRLNLGYQTQLGRWLPLNIDYTYSRGVNLYGVRDLNLDETATFVLPAEGRPFYGSPSAIAAATGQTTYAASRIDPAFAHVFEYRSDLRSEAHQLTLRVNGMLPWQRILMQGSYTLGFARDQTAFSGGGIGGGFGGGFGGFSGGGFSAATTAGNPNVPEWATSGNDRRHSVSLVAAWPARDWVQLTMIGRLASGSPFTPMVGGDVNGDGMRNDRAFIFDARTATDTAVANGMARLFDRVPGGVRDCLESQRGTLAARNTCRNPWTQSLDLRLNLSPRLPRVDRRLNVSADLSNVLAALDQAFHGRDGLRGWGQPNRADATLLYPRAFDPVTQSFRYEVNEQFGQARTQRFGQGAPFQLVLQAQLRVGQQRGGPGGLGGLIAMGGLGGFGEGGRGGAPARAGGGFAGPGGGPGRGSGPGGFSPAAILERLLANPIPVLLELRDTLGLTPDQVERVQAISDSLQTKLDARRAELARRFENVQTGDIQSMGRIFQEMQPQTEAYRSEVGQALDAVRTVLTPEQWDRVPQRVRSPFGPGPRGRGPVD